jgi:hypothetical protein
VAALLAGLPPPQDDAARKARRWLRRLLVKGEVAGGAA